MTMMRGTAIHRLAPILLLGVLVTWCTASLDMASQRGIDDVVMAAMGCKPLVGLSVVMVKDGQVITSKGYGVKDKDTQEPVTSNTLFQIASLTKAFTSALLSHVLKQNTSHTMFKSIHSSHILPSSFRFNKTELTSYTTLADLLSHRTGVPRNSFLRLASDYSIDSLVEKLRYLPAKGGFRSSYYYNDEMYGLAALITEKLGHAKWEQQIRDTIFRPLGMDNSTFISEVNFDTADVARPYTMESGVLQKASTDFIRHWGRNTGSGSIYTSANDISQWLLALLNGGQSPQGRQVLQQAVLEEVFKPRAVVPRSGYSASFRRPVTPVTFSGDMYGMGWRLGFYDGYSMAYHSGTTFGYRAYLTLLPDMGIGVVSLMTGVDPSYYFRTALHAYLMDVALGHTPWVNSSTVCTFPEPWKSAHLLSPPSSDEEDNTEQEDHNVAESKPTRALRTQPVNIGAYVGTYHHEAYGDLTVLLNTSTATLELLYGIGHWQLGTVDGYHFEGRWLKDYPKLNLNFLFHGEGQEIQSVTAVDFEKSIPPVFFKKSDDDAESLIG